MASDESTNKDDNKSNDNTSKLAMSDKTEIATSIEAKPMDKNMKVFGAKKKKPLVTTMADTEEAKDSTENTRGIPRALYLQNPYDIIYKNQQERYLREVEDTLGKYRLMESQLVKQKMSKVDQQKEMKNNIEVCGYLKEKGQLGTEIKTQFEVSDQLYSEGTIKEFDTVAIWLGANVMMEFPIDEAVVFLEKRIVISKEKIADLQTDIDFTRKQMNIIEVNRSRVYNAGVKVKKAREIAAGKQKK
eukprot:310192_1